jgi:Lipocalin-like domain
MFSVAEYAGHMGSRGPGTRSGACSTLSLNLKRNRNEGATGDGRQEAHADQVREYNTYAGTYTFDGKRLITRVDCCSNPAYMGTEQVREVSHEGGLMVLQPPVRAYVGRPPEQRVLYWERISNIDG